MVDAETRLKRLSREWWPFVLAFAFIAVLLRPWAIVCTLNDDWAYLLPALRLATSGELRLTDWASPTQLLHIAWGALIMRMASFDVGAVKLGMLAWLLGACAILYRLLRRARTGQMLSTIAALVLVFNPITLTLAISFMTDIPYLTLSLAAIACAARAGDNRSDRPLWLGAIAAAAAYLVRQTGLLLPVAVTLVLWRQGRLSRRNLLIAWGPVAAVVAAHQIWFYGVHGPTWATQVYLRDATASFLSDPPRLAGQTVLRIVGATACLGFFAWPILVCTAAPVLLRPLRTRAGGIAAGLFAIAMIAVCANSGGMPILENSMRPDGFGVVTVAGPEARVTGFFTSTWFWPLVTLLSIMGGAIWLAMLATLRQFSTLELALASTLVMQLAATLIGASYYDRYLIVPLSCALALTTLQIKDARPLVWRGACAFAVLATVSLLGTMDYAAWNMARWRLASQAVTDGAAPDQIAAGMDWLGYHTYEPAMAQLKQRKPLAEIGEWDWQMQFPRQFQISFDSNLDRLGFKRLGMASYDTPLGDGLGAVYLYEMNPQVLIASGDQAAALEDFEQAILCYRSALLIEPGKAETHNRLGVALAQDNRIDEAIVHFEQALHAEFGYQPAIDNLQRARDALKNPGSMGR